LTTKNKNNKNIESVSDRDRDRKREEKIERVSEFYSRQLSSLHTCAIKSLGIKQLN